MFSLFISLAYFCALELFRNTKMFQRLEEIRERFIEWLVSLFQKDKKTFERWKKGALLALIIALSIPYVLMAKNITVKMMPIGKERAIAEVQDHEINEAEGSRGATRSNIYTLTYTFKGADDHTYKTKRTFRGLHIINMSTSL